MSASFVQKAQAHGSGVTSITTVGMTTTTGNTVVVSIGSGADFTTLTDNGTSNTVTAVAQPKLNPGGGELDLTVKCLMNINGKAGHTFTANFSGSDFVSMTASELAGVAASSLDVGSVASGSDLTSPYTVTSGTFAQASEIVLFINEPYCAGTSTFAESTGFTSIGGENDNNTYCGNWNWWKSISATTALTPSVTDSTGTGYSGMLTVIAGFKSAAAGGTSVAPGAGAITLTGPVPTVARTANQAVAPSQAAVTFTGQVPTVARTANQALTPSQGAVSFTGYAPSISQSAGLNLTPGVGAIAFTGFAPTIALNQSVTPGAGAMTFMGYAPTIAQPKALSPGAGALSLAGFAPSVTQASASLSLTPGASLVTISGFAPSLTQTGSNPYPVGSGGGPLAYFPSQASIKEKARREKTAQWVDDEQAKTRRLTKKAASVNPTPPIEFSDPSEVVLNALPRAGAVLRQFGATDSSAEKRRREEEAIARALVMLIDS